MLVRCSPDLRSLDQMLAALSSFWVLNTGRSLLSILSLSFSLIPYTVVTRWSPQAPNLRRLGHAAGSHDLAGWCLVWVPPISINIIRSIAICLMSDFACIFGLNGEHSLSVCSERGVS